MTGKLSAQAQNDGLARVLAEVQVIQPAYFMAIDPGSEAADALAQSGVRLIVRHYGKLWDLVDSPQDNIAPADFVADCVAQHWFPSAWAVCTPVGNAQADPNWLAEIVDRLRAYGKECIVGNWLAGTNGVFVPGASYYGVQEYSWPSLQDHQGDGPLRYRNWFPEVLARSGGSAKLFITELGITPAFLNQGPDVGYRTAKTPEQYWNQDLEWYAHRLDEDDYVLAAFVYGLGMNPDWSTFEISHTSIPLLMQLYGSTQPPATGGGPATGGTPISIQGATAIDLAAILAVTVIGLSIGLSVRHARRGR